MKTFAKYLLIVVPWAVLLYLGIAYLWGNVLSFPWVWKEKGRVAAPSGECEVVTYEGNRGAMSSFAYVSFIVKPGAKANPNKCDYYEPILSSTHSAPKFRWADNHRLVITPEGGYVTHERPYSREFQVAIEIESGSAKAIPSPAGERQ